MICGFLCRKFDGISVLQIKMGNLDNLRTILHIIPLKCLLGLNIRIVSPRQF